MCAMESEEELVARAVRGDDDAFRVLVVRHEHLVTHLVFRLIRDESAREDLCQEVFIRVYAKLAGFRHQSKLSTWIARVAYSTCINYLQRHRLALAREESLSGEPVGERFFDAAPSPAEHVAQDELHAFLRGRIEGLPVISRAVITLHYLDGMSLSEVGEVIGAPVGTVKSYLFRARAMLKRQLLERYTPDELMQ